MATIIVKNAKAFNVRKIQQVIDEAREKDYVYIDYHTLIGMQEVLDFYKANYKE